MLEKVDLTKKISKEEYKAKMPQMEIELGRLQRECRELKIPVMIVFEGFGASGKGVQIGKLIRVWIREDFRYFRSKQRLRMNECIRSCGDSGQRPRRRGGLLSLMAVGTGKS